MNPLNPLKKTPLEKYLEHQKKIWKLTGIVITIAISARILWWLYNKI